MNTLWLCIDFCGEDIRGRMYSRMSETLIRFENCSDMLLKADALFDERGYPQTFQEKRSFIRAERKAVYDSSPRERMMVAEILKQKGLCATFQIIVWSRSRAGWQGLLLRENGDTIAKFKSELELLEELQRELKARAPDR